MTSKNLSVIKTSGDLRSYLIKIMLEIENGTVTTAIGKNVIKASEEINNSFRNEMQFQKVLVAAGKANEIVPLGSVNLV